MPIGIAVVDEAKTSRLWAVVEDHPRRVHEDGILTLFRNKQHAINECGQGDRIVLLEIKEVSER